MITCLFEDSFIWASTYLVKITLFDCTQMMILANLVAIGVEISMIDSGCPMEKEFIQ